MQKNDETFSKFIEFKPMVEKETCKKIKAPKSDNGGDYMSNYIKFFCQK